MSANRCKSRTSLVPVARILDAFVTDPVDAPHGILLPLWFGFRPSSWGVPNTRNSEWPPLSTVSNVRL
jgi:hypothetical protein